MKVLFDNNVPAPLRHRLAGHDIYTARELDWHELRNGDLLQQGEISGFDVLVTGDKNLSYQQNLEGRTIAVVVLGTTRWKLLREDTGPVADAVDRASPGSFQALPMSFPPRRLSRRSGPQP